MEDAVRAALLAALESWSSTEVPENPSAWLYRVAHRKVLGELRGRARRGGLLDGHDDHALPSSGEPPGFLAADVRDSLLRMLAGSYLWSAVLADLHRCCGNDELANRYRDTAIELAPSAAVRTALLRRLGAGVSC